MAVKIPRTAISVGKPKCEDPARVSLKPSTPKDSGFTFEIACKKEGFKV